MRRFLLTACLVAVLLWEAGAIPAPQVPVENKGKFGVPEQETEKAWGSKAVEPLEDDQLGVLLPMPKKLSAAKENPPDVKAWMETEDILSGFRSPYQGPDPDLDSLYHPMSGEIQDKEEPKLWAMLHHQAVLGPEEDRDRIFHPMEDSSGP